jgi:hypothetical protein
MACWLGLPTYSYRQFEIHTSLIRDDFVSARRDLVEFGSNWIRNYHLANSALNRCWNGDNKLKPRR